MKRKMIEFKVTVEVDENMDSGAIMDMMIDIDKAIAPIIDTKDEILHLIELENKNAVNK